MKLLRACFRLRGREVSDEDLRQLLAGEPAERAQLLRLLVPLCETLRLGGFSYGLDDLPELHELELTALAAAENRLRVSQAVRIASAAQGPLGIAEVLGEIDGGQFRDELTAELGAELALSRLNVRDARAARAGGGARGPR